MIMCPCESACAIATMIRKGRTGPDGRLYRNICQSKLRHYPILVPIDNFPANEHPHGRQRSKLYNRRKAPYDSCLDRRRLGLAAFLFDARRATAAIAWCSPEERFFRGYHHRRGQWKRHCPSRRRHTGAQAEEQPVNGSQSGDKRRSFAPQTGEEFHEEECPNGPCRRCAGHAGVPADRRFRRYGIAQLGIPPALGVQRGSCQNVKGQGECSLSELRCSPVVSGIRPLVVLLPAISGRLKIAELSRQIAPIL